MSKVCRKCAMVFGSQKALDDHLATAHGVGVVAKAPHKAPKKAVVKEKAKEEDK